MIFDSFQKAKRYYISYTAVFSTPSTTTFKLDEKFLLIIN